MFEQKFAELRPLAVKRNAQRIQLQENLRKTSLAFRQRFYPELGEEPGPPVETNLPMEMILKMGVPEELLLPYAAVSAKEFPECSRMISGFKGRDWWLTKQTWTFQPEEMRDLVFQPAAAVFLEDLAGDAGFYVAQNLVRLGPNAVPALVQALQSRNPRVRIHAAWVLNMMNGEETVTRDIRVLECLPVLFQDPEWEVRMEAARAAGGSWNPKFAEPIIHLLQDTNGGVAHSAVFALVRNSQGRAEHHAVLWAMLKDENLAVRANALEVLEAGRTPIPREAVLPLLGVPDMRMVSLAVRHLEQDGVGYQDLIPLLNNPERMARLTGLRVLGELADKEAVGVIIPLLRDPEPVVQKQAWTLLKTLTGQEIPRDQPRQWGQWWAEHRIPVLIAEDTKSIQLNSTHGEEYHMRGCLYYDSRQFAKARADFLKAGQLGADYPDYPHYRLWLIRARLGETAAATRELEAYLAARKTGQPGDWPSQVGRFLAGQVSEAEFLKAAKNPNAQTDREQQCEAWFYAGMKRLIAGEQTTATRYFKHCLGTGVENFEEYASARAELEFLAAKR
jgi:HEAT repeat protein